ncbi:TRAP transporter large permease [Pseudooceanicola sp. HF7]|uniref:TRAP transporter large permease n=1 Tax=Pseudooceanicola sp. HF7 TaxID=2721560 RepID=UPI001430CCEB|nr:TRAP transporter large permease [Pseudooceanicola sp. HF7]NIZ11370.1 TRAP transporter large permease [Pseudooceanicola sp. HF7]
MTDMSIGLTGLAVLLVLLTLRIPVAFAMFAVGFTGIALLRSFDAATGLLASESFTLASSSELIVVPLFILMGNVATSTGMSRRLYDAAYALIGQIRGGLASATVIGCGGFAALSGSSVASALTMGKVSLGEMERFGYDSRLSAGSVAAGGTLGILIPPSTGFVIYAILAQESIGRLFLAGVLPGLLLLSMFVLTITLLCWALPALAPAGPRTSAAQKLRALGGAAPIMTVIVLTIGGIYGGLFSPVEAAAVGAGLVILFGILSRTLTLAILWQASRDSVVTTATVMLILISAHMMNPFLALSHIPQAIGAFLGGMDLPPMAVLGLILLCYLVLGCFLEGFAMLVLSMPIFFPVIVSLGIDPIWFGVLVVLTLEMGLISPPVGVNVFIVKSIAPKVPLGQIFIGVIPFWIAMLLTLGLLIAFPSISLFLPDTMIGTG